MNDINLDKIEEKERIKKLADEEIIKNFREKININDKINEEDQQLIKEGKTVLNIFTTIVTENAEEEEHESFYNSVQEFNRDLTILVVKLYSKMMKESNAENYKGLTILDAMSGCGIRGIRFLNELEEDEVKFVIANDISENFTNIIKSNIKLNKLNENKIKVLSQDAIKLMYEAKEKVNKGDNDYNFDVIELDPFGTAIPFLDSAIQAIKNDGLICVSFTDLKVLSGPEYPKCFSWYNCVRSRMSAYQENAIRIALFSINSIANKQGKYIIPLLSYQSEFYLRVYVIVRNSKSECSKTLSKLGNVFLCENCTNFHIFPLGTKYEKNNTINYIPAKINLETNKCEQCEGIYTFNGPIWIDKINDFNFVKKMIDFLISSDYKLKLKTKKKIFGLLYGILREEETAKFPLSLNIQYICKFIKISTPNKLNIYSAIDGTSYKISQSYLNRDLWKTDAPLKIIFDALRFWKKKNIDEEKDLFKNLENVDDPAYIFLSKKIEFFPDFEKFTDENSIPNKIAIYFPNPEKNWGPKKKPKKIKFNTKLTEKNDSKI